MARKERGRAGGREGGKEGGRKRWGDVWIYENGREQGRHARGYEGRLHLGHL